MANLPVSEQLETAGTVAEAGQQIVTAVASLEPIVFEVSSNLTEMSESVLPQVNLTLNHPNQNKLDLTVLEGLSDELHSDLRLNGVSIVDVGEINTLEDSDLDESDLDLPGLSEQVDAGFDDVFSDWAGPIL